MPQFRSRGHGRSRQSYPIHQGVHPYGKPRYNLEVSAYPIVLAVRSASVTYDEQTGIATYRRSNDPEKMVRFRPTAYQKKVIATGKGGVNIHQNQVVSSSVPGVSE